MGSPPIRLHIPLLLPAVLALLTALWAGLMRLGWPLPAAAPALALGHGPLMISGFLGALILLERAVALRAKWMYLPPLLCGLGWAAALLIPPPAFGSLLLTLASLGGVFILLVILRREPALHTLTLFLGTLSWLGGNLLWLSGRPIFQAVPLWQAFLVLTIAGERVELSRVLRPSRTRQAVFGMILLTLLGGAVLSTIHPQAGAKTSGAGLLALAVWSTWNDIAWRNLRHSLPLTRYIARCLAAGFVWLGIGGILNLALGAQAAGPRYDAVLHAVLVGFVFSMIFGHAPIIFPSILGAPIRFRPAFYVHVILLHTSLILRVFADLAGQHPLRMWAGLANGVAILLFLAITAASMRKGPADPFGAAPSP